MHLFTRLLSVTLVTVIGSFFVSPVVQAVGITTSTVAVSTTVSVVPETLTEFSVSSVATTSVSSSLTTDFIVQPDDLLHVGFVGVERILPSQGRFEEPVRYFRVKAIPSAKDKVTDCDDCENLVSIYVARQMVTSTPVWVVRANPLILPVGGRLQLRWFAGNRIIFVTAPGGEARVKALGAWIRERVILGKIN